MSNKRPSPLSPPAAREVEPAKPWRLTADEQANNADCFFKSAQQPRAAVLNALPSEEPATLNSKSFSQRVIEATSDGFFEWHPALKYMRFSDNLAQLLGYGCDHGPLSAAQLANHIHPEDHHDVCRQMTEAVYQGQAFTTRFRMQTTNEEWRWYQMHLTILEKDEWEQATLLAGCIRDIHEDVTATNELTQRVEAEQWLTRTIQGLMQSDDDRAVEASLSRLCDFLGVDHSLLRTYAEDGTGFRFVAAGHHSELTQPLDYDEVLPLNAIPPEMYGLQSGRPFTISTLEELEANSPLRNILSGLGICSMAILPVIYEGHVDHFLSLMMTRRTVDWNPMQLKVARILGDNAAMISARRRVTQQLQQSAERVLNVLDATQDGIWDWDIANDDYYVSPSFLYLLGYDEEFLPMTRDKLQQLLVEPTSLPALFTEPNSDSGRPANIFFRPAQLRHRNGDPVSVLVRGKQIQWDDTGQPTRGVGAVTTMQWYEAALNGDTQSTSGQTPVSQAPDQSNAHASSIDEDPLNGKTFLLVEDNPVNQQVAKGILQRWDVRVVLANNGQEALDIMHRQPRAFDLVLMDMEMPILDGYEATRRLRADTTFEQLPIVALTAHATQEDRQKAFAAGVNDHVAKPIRPDILYNAVRQQLRLHKH